MSGSIAAVVGVVVVSVLTVVLAKRKFGSNDKIAPETENEDEDDYKIVVGEESAVIGQPCVRYKMGKNLITPLDIISPSTTTVTGTQAHEFDSGRQDTDTDCPLIDTEIAEYEFNPRKQKTTSTLLSGSPGLTPAESVEMEQFR